MPLEELLTKVPSLVGDGGYELAVKCSTPRYTLVFIVKPDNVCKHLETLLVSIKFTTWPR